MASKLSLKNRPPFLCFLVIPYLPEPAVHLFALHTEFLLTGFSKEDKLPLSVPSAVMGEPKEIKGKSKVLAWRFSMLARRRYF